MSLLKLQLGDEERPVVAFKEEFSEKGKNNLDDAFHKVPRYVDANL